MTESTKSLFFKSTIIGTIIDVFLGIFKIIVGLQYFSHALILDGFHSFSDVITDIFVLFISKFSNESPDENHPYGHEKIETIGTLALGSILIATSGALLYEVILRLIENHNTTPPGNLTLAVAMLSILVKESLYRYRLKIGKELNSSILIANAWHSRSDALSSIAVFVGIIFTKFGFPVFDSIAGLIVVLMIGRVAWFFIKDSLMELIETSLDMSVTKEIKQIILASEGVLDFHNLRSRKVGPNAFVDVNIQVKPKISVSEGHEIATWVVSDLKRKIPMIVDVTIHVDIENDLETPFRSSSLKLLPLREKIRSDIMSCYSNPEFFQSIQKWEINYGAGSLSIALFFEKSNKSIQTLNSTDLLKKCSSIQYLNNITFYYS